VLLLVVLPVLLLLLPVLLLLLLLATLVLKRRCDAYATALRSAARSARACVAWLANDDEHL